MTAPPNSDLEQRLGEPTEWTGPHPPLWQRVLESERPRPGKRSPRLAPLTARWAWAGLAAAACVVAVATLYYQTTMWGEAEATYGLEAASDPWARVAATPADGPAARSVAEWAAGSPGADGMPVASGMSRGDGAGSAPVARPLPSTRQVIRKATIEVKCEDVRAAYLRTQQLVNTGTGEFVEHAQLRHAGTRMQAELTLRVRADRLHEVLTSTRALGDVVDESTQGEDVTGQAVDLQARIRNEQRVELELLDLLEKRSDSPLAEVLDLRAALDEVRLRIEQLTAQRDELNELVALATVLVIIRPTESVDQADAGTLSTALWQALADGWYAGASLLVATLGRLVQVLVGGLIWWLLIAVLAGVLWRRAWRRGA